MFSDGVFAIAITLLVVELPFEQVREGELGQALGDHWASFVGYVVSFGSIGIAWLHHHAVFGSIARVDRRIMLLNMFTLLAVAFLPFPTSLLGDYLAHGGDDARLAVAIYSANWILITVFLGAIWTHALRGRGLLEPDVDRDGAGLLLRYIRGATVLYVVLGLLAIASPLASIIMYGVAAAFFLVRSDYRALGKEAVE